MSGLGLVAYGDSDSDDEPSASTTSKQEPAGTAFVNNSRSAERPLFPQPISNNPRHPNSDSGFRRPGFPPPGPPGTATRYSDPRFPASAGPSGHPMNVRPQHDFRNMPPPNMAGPGLFPVGRPGLMDNQRSGGSVVVRHSGNPAGSAAGPPRTASAYTGLGLDKDEKGRVRIVAPRLEHPDSDEEEDEKRNVKRPKVAPSGQGGLFAVLPDAKGGGKRGVDATVSTSKSGGDLDALFASSARKRQEAASGAQTIKVPSTSTVRFEAELKKAQVLQKYLKKPKGADESVKAPPRRGQETYHEGDGYNAEPDYLGLAPRHVDTYPPDANEDDTDVGWEVDESAYNDDDYQELLPQPHYPSEYENPSAPDTSAYAPPMGPGPVWTANYKYQDVQHILNQPPPPVPHPGGYRTDEQIQQLIARYEGPEFHQHLNMGHSIDIVDFRADEVLGNARENVMRGLTDEATNPGPPKPVAVKGRAKQRGQITYLVAQAQAKESELQNQWAKGRQTRQQTSMKYGF